MKHSRKAAHEASAQHMRQVTVLGAPPSAVPAGLEAALYSLVLLFLFLGGTLGCLITGFHIPVFSSVLYFGIPLLAALMILGDRLLRQLPLLYVLPPLLLLLYIWQRFDALRDGFFYIAANILRFLCWGFPGILMPEILSEHEQYLIHAETNDLLLTTIRAPITESLFVFAVGLGFVWVFLRQHNHSTWLSAALPLPIFILCFLIIETTIPSLQALLFLLLYWILLLFTRTTLHLHIRAAASQTMVLLLPCILFLAAVYLWYPRQTPVGQMVQSGYDKVLDTISMIETTVSDTAGSLFSGGWFTVSAEGSEISFQSLGPRRFLGRTVMRAKSDTPGVIYLRENTYGTYTDKGWEQTVYDGVIPPDGLPNIQRASAPLLADAGIDPSRLSLDGARSPLMFTPYYFSDATVDYAFDGDSRITNPGRKTDYSISFYRFPGNFDALQYDTPASAASMVQLMQYMKDTVPVYQSIEPELAAALLAILEDAGIAPSDFSESFVFEQNNSIRIVTDYEAMWDLIADITYFVRASAEYSLNADRNTTGRDFVLWFLEDAEYGYCTHFATAEVMLLRACGIPARLVSGFLGNIRTADQWAAIKDSNAHAWTEVFDARLGWIPVEATPPGSVSDGVRGDDIIVGVTPIPSVGETVTETEAVTEPAETTEPFSTEPVPEETAAQTAPSSPQQTEAVTADTSAETSEGGIGSGGSQNLTRLLSVIGYGLLTVIGIGVLLSVPLLLRHLRQKNIAALLTPTDEERNACALRLYRRCVSLARACGEELPAALTAAAEKARFSQHILSQEELDIMVQWYQSKCHRLQEQDKPLPRLRHYWFDSYY